WSPMCASQEPLHARGVRHRYCAQPRLNAMCVTGWSFHRGAGLHAPLASGLTPHVVIVVEELPRDLHARGMREDRASIVDVPTTQTKFVADTSLHERLEAVRSFIRERMLRSREPASRAWD